MAPEDDEILDNLARLNALDPRARTVGIKPARARADDPATEVQKAPTPPRSVPSTAPAAPAAMDTAHKPLRPAAGAPERLSALAKSKAETAAPAASGRLERPADPAPPRVETAPARPTAAPAAAAAPKLALPDSTVPRAVPSAPRDTAPGALPVPATSGVPGPLDDLARGVTIGMAPFDYQAALMRIIETTTSDPRELRNLVYDLARKNLKREAWEANPSLTSEGVRDCLSALETAIERVESDLSGSRAGSAVVPRLPTYLVRRPHDPATGDGDAAPAQLRGHRSTGAPAAPEEGPESAGEVVPSRERWTPAPEPALSTRAAARPQVEIVYPERSTPEARMRRRVWLWFIVWPFVQVAGPIAFCVALYFVFSGRLGIQAPPSLPTAEQSEATTTIAELPPHTAGGLPLPSSYGVYAVSNGELSELEPLPIKAPDPRVMLSAEISKPSMTTLPDGKIVFVLFRRDLVNNAPQKASVRVVARVAHAVSFSNGKAVSADVQGTWRIRSNAYEFNVAPVPENREMVLLRPLAPDFVLRAGRYALILEGLAYDFTVEGAIKDPAQCLESVAAVNGSVYTECGPN